MNDVISERKEIEGMHTEMVKMKKEKTYLEGLIK
jgi:predicted RNA-binding protein